MNLAYTLTGSAPLVKRYKVGVSSTVSGIPITIGAAGSAGVSICDVTAAVDALGVSVDTATYSTTQGDTEGMIAVIVNPDAVYRVRMSGSATLGAALTVTTNDVAETAGVEINKTGASGVGDPDPNSPTKDEGIAFCLSGANAGQSRKIVTVGATTATVLVPFLNDIGSGDEFLIVPWCAMDVAGNDIQLTTNLQEARQDVIVGTGIDFRIIDLDWAFPDRTSARTQSYVLGLLDDHVLNNTT